MNMFRIDDIHKKGFDRRPIKTSNPRYQKGCGLSLSGPVLWSVSRIQTHSLVIYFPSAFSFSHLYKYNPVITPLYMRVYKYKETTI